LETSEILFESLALFEYVPKDRNAIVARIARMTITTMSSTRVNHRALTPTLSREEREELMQEFRFEYFNLNSPLP
jgi:hypothetical protein